VIPNGNDYILYEPRKPNVMLVNGALVRILQRIQRGEKEVYNTHKDLIQQLVSQNMVVNGNQTKSIQFPKRREEFNPSGVSLFLTTACSMRCIYCYSYGGEIPNNMPWPIAQTAIDWIVAHTISKGNKNFYVRLHGGGEVTTAADLMKKCVAYVRKQAESKQLNARIESGLNGVMNTEVTDWVAEHLDGATISLDGIPDVQNIQRPLANGRASFPVVSETLRRLDKKKFNYAIRMTVTQERIDKVAESVSYIAKKFAAKTIQVEPVFLIGRALETKLAAVNADMFIEQFREAKRLAAKHGKQLKYSGARLHTKTNSFCKAVGGDSFSVTTTGWVSSCYEVNGLDDPRAELFFYGRYDQTTGQFVFNEKKIDRLRSLTVENKVYCNKCFCKWHCAGDCPAKLAALGDAWRPDENFRCHINQELTKDQIMEFMDQHDTSIEY